jgi:hypothetical protein
VGEFNRTLRMCGADGYLCAACGNILAAVMLLQVGSGTE